jgi:hypothetical protein
MLFCSYATMTSFYVAVVIFSGFVATVVERRPIEFTFVEFEYVVVFCLMMAVTVVLTGFTVCICIYRFYGIYMCVLLDDGCHRCPYRVYGIYVYG